MAFVNDGFEITVTWGGIDDSSQTRTYQLDTATVTTYTEALDALTDILTAAGGVSDGVVKSYTVKAKSVENAYNRPTATTTERGDGAVVSGEIATDPTKKWTFTVPYPKLGIFQAIAGSGYNIVDPSDTALIAYKDLFGPLGPCTISDGEKAGNITGGKRA